MRLSRSTYSYKTVAEDDKQIAEVLQELAHKHDRGFEKFLHGTKKGIFLESQTRISRLLFIEAEYTKEAQKEITCSR